MKHLLPLLSLSLCFTTTAFAGDYPTEENERALIGQQGLQLDANLGKADGSMGIGAGASYGINEKMSASAAWGGMTFGDAGALQKAIALGAAYSLMDGDELDLAAGLNLPLSFEEGAAMSVGIDMNTRYLLMDGKLAIKTGDGLITYTTGDAGGLGLGLNLGLAYQVNENINAGFGTNIMSMAGGATTFIGDAIPVSLDVGYNMDDIDVLLGIDMDAKAASDTLGFGLGVSYRM
jgi:predicted porin